MTTAPLTDDSETCPACGSNLTGGEIPEKDREYYGGAAHFSRVIGIENHDRIVAWRCPDCGFETPRGMAKDSQPDARELIFELRIKDGTAPLSRLPGLWSRRLNDQWHMWVNGHMDGPRKTEPGDHGSPGGADVNPGDVYLEFNGWPAGCFSIIDGEGVLAAGGIANYDTLCKALKEALADGREG